MSTQIINAAPMVIDLGIKDTNIKPLPEHTKGVVIYTDGGCRPGGRGNVGWGVHGYLYTTEPATRGPGLATHMITGSGYVSATPEAKKAFSAVQPIHYFDFFGSSTALGTNNSVEIDALYHALDHLQVLEFSKITVYTDSEYLRRGMEEFVDQWQASGWKKADGSDVQNVFNWKRLLQTIKTYRDKNIEIDINWVKGHNGIFGNHHADLLATVGVMYSISGISRAEFKVSDAQGYWKSEIERHPFMGFKRLYFNSSPQFNVPGQYLMAEPGHEDHLIGKKYPETSYAIIRMNEIDPIIELVKKKQFDLSNAINSVVMMRLDRVFSSHVYPYLLDHGEFALFPSKKDVMSLNFLDDKPITNEQNPAGLSLRAVETFDFLELLLNQFLTGEENIKDFASFDITDNFYNKEQKKKKDEIIDVYTLKADIKPGLKNVPIKLNVPVAGKEHSVVIPLLLGGDILPRNNLKKLEEMQPTISLITWSTSSHAFKYACVIKTNSGIGIWSNYYTDQIFVS